MTNTALRILLFWLLATAHSSAQPATKKPVKLFFEKTYLHTDRNTYMAGDTLWFKAYLVAQNNTPTTTSGTLYTELVSAAGQIIDNHIIKLTDGFGHGDYQLPDTLATGKYHLRAYTNWMRNFGNEFIFDKEITVIRNNAVTVAQSPKTTPRKLSAVNSSIIQSKATVNFYPEGGALVNHIVSMLAVKAEDARGRGHAVTGVIISASGDTAARFNCDSLGMGSFPFLPLSGVSYHAMVGNISYTFPAALNKGLVLKVNQADAIMAVTVQQTDSVPVTASITVKHAGATIVNHPLKIERQATVNFVTTDFPQGISSVTLYDERGRPQCERLVYIHHRGGQPVLINADKPYYNTGEDVAIKVTGPINTNLSMAVVDAGLASKAGGDVVSYLMLQSEIKGTIENPGQYFDTANVNRFKQTDLLLMTQGWRDFIWRRLADTVLNANYPAETGIAVKGFIEDEITKKRLPRLNITLYATGAKGNKLFSDVTNTTGSFAFTNADLYGVQDVLLASVDNTGKKKGTFMIDTLTVPLQLRRQADTTDVVEQKAELQHTYEQRESIGKDIGIKKVVKLDAVKVTGKRKVYMLRSGYTYTPWGPKPQSFTITPDDEKFKTLEWYILQNARGAHAKIGSGVTFSKRGEPVLIVNGEEINLIDSTYFYDLYYNMPITKFKSIKLEYVIGALNDEKVLLHLALKDNAMIDNPGSLTLKVNGYYNARNFYQPTKQNELSAAQLSPTLYWQPYVKTGADGVALIKFRSGLIPSKYNVILQGVSSDGKPVSAIGLLEVK